MKINSSWYEHTKRNSWLSNCRVTIVIKKSGYFVETWVGGDTQAVELNNDSFLNSLSLNRARKANVGSATQCPVLWSNALNRVWNHLRRLKKTYRKSRGYQMSSHTQRKYSMCFKLILNSGEYRILFKFKFEIWDLVKIKERPYILFSLVAIFITPGN